jgi:hypothetical protein
MTVRELDQLILRVLKTGARTAQEIHAKRVGGCTLYDVQAALRIWARNGWARELGAGTYELVKEASS